MADEDDAGAGSGDYSSPLTESQIAFEGFLRVRASKGIAGMRPWLLRCVPFPFATSCEGDEDPPSMTPGGLWKEPFPPCAREHASRIPPPRWDTGPGLARGEGARQTRRTADDAGWSASRVLGAAPLCLTGGCGRI